MNVFCAFCVFCGSLLAQPGSAAFVGHWRLVTFENFDENRVARDAGYEYQTAKNPSSEPAALDARVLNWRFWRL